MIPIIRALIAILIVGVVSLFVVPLQWIALRLNLKMKTSIPPFWHRLVVSLIGVRVIVHGTPDVKRPLLVLANHTSWLDVPVIGSLGSVAFAANRGEQLTGLFGMLARLQPAIFLPRAGSQPKPGQSDQMLVVFAEGASNAGNSVLPFQSDLLTAASQCLGGSQSDIQVQPLSIAYTTLQGLPMGRQFRPVVAWTGTIRFLPHFWTVLREYSVDAVVSFGDPIHYVPGSDPVQIVHQAEDSVRKMTANVLTGRDPF